MKLLSGPLGEDFILSFLQLSKKKARSGTHAQEISIKKRPYSLGLKSFFYGCFRCYRDMLLIYVDMFIFCGPSAGSAQ